MSWIFLLLFPQVASLPPCLVKWKVNSFGHKGILCKTGVLYRVKCWGGLRDWHRVGLWGRFPGQNVMGNNTAQLLPRQSQRRFYMLSHLFFFFLSCHHGIYSILQTVLLLFVTFLPVGSSGAWAGDLDPPLCIVGGRNNFWLRVRTLTTFVEPWFSVY